ncbi:uncharacterized protein [Nicotiana tomentosiformis]|uniref:uncharacterized protein n=1 Tax=Nicotiana tomentosiformis TaxID=4098 RepID=UPI00388C6634
MTENRASPWTFLDLEWVNGPLNNLGSFSIFYVLGLGAGLDEEIKKCFWEDLDGLVHGIPHTEKLFIRGDFNGHIGVTSGGYDGVHDDFGFGVRNGGGTSLLDCAKAFDLVIANSCFPKREEQLVTFQSSLAKTQIDYLLL